MSNLSTAYSDHTTETCGPQVSMIERAHLCDLFDAVGPDQPTLCKGWTTHHLVAHLKLRESNPLDQFKSILPGLGDKAVAAVVRSGPFDALVAAIRSGPPRLSIYGLPTADSRFNTIEFLIHHEDVRRAAPSWQPRVLPLWAEDQIWGRLTGLARFTLRTAPVGVVLERTDRDPLTDPAARAEVTKGETGAVVRGLPSELALFAYGRRDVARVELDGSPEVLTTLTRKRH